MENWARYTIQKLGNFGQLHKRTYWSNCKIFQMGLFSFDPNLFMTLFLTHKCLAMVIFYFYDLSLNFRTFNSKLNYIKYENNIFFQKGWFYTKLEVQDSPIHLPNSCMIMHWRGNQISFKIWFLFEKYWMLQIKSFFTLFPLSNSSINTKHHSQPQTRNPSQRTNPYSCKNFQETWKNRVLVSSHFQPSNIIPSCSEGKFE